jgi:hypothetical protein
MSETYREDNEANFGESVAHRFIKGLEDEIGVPNAFGSEDLEDDGEEPDNDTFETREDEPHELYDDQGGYN